MMVRTQVYLTEYERKQLLTMVKRTGKSQSMLIREAIDAYMESLSSDARLSILKKARGMWRDRKDLSDFKKLRAEMDRQIG